MATLSERDSLEIMLENLSPEQRAAVNAIAHAEKITPKEALLLKLKQEEEESRNERSEGHAP